MMNDPDEFYNIFKQAIQEEISNNSIQVYPENELEQNQLDLQQQISKLSDVHIFLMNVFSKKLACSNKVEDVDSQLVKLQTL